MFHYRFYVLLLRFYDVLVCMYQTQTKRRRELGNCGLLSDQRTA